MGMPKTCECEDKPDKKIFLTSSESECCKVNVKEINNSNTLESNKLILTKHISFQVIHFIPQKLNPILTNNFKIFTGQSKSPSDIPILTSTLLI